MSSAVVVIVATPVKSGIVVGAEVRSCTGVGGGDIIADELGSSAAPVVSDTDDIAPSSFPPSLAVGVAAGVAGRMLFIASAIVVGTRGELGSFAATVPGSEKEGEEAPPSASAMEGPLLLIATSIAGTLFLSGELGSNMILLPPLPEALEPGRDEEISPSPPPTPAATVGVGIVLITAPGASEIDGREGAGGPSFIVGTVTGT